MKRLLLLPLAAICAVTAGHILTSCTDGNAMDISSPDGRLQFSLHLDQDGALYYTVNRDGQAVVDSSGMGIACKEVSLGRHAKVKKIEKSSADETWSPVWGEESRIRNHYNEMAVTFEEQPEGDALPVAYTLRVRVFPDGVGFRYEVPGQTGVDSLTVMDELTEFALAEDGVAWSIPWDHEYYEHLYEPSLVSRLDTVCSPLTIKMTDSLYVSIHEAALEDYAAMNLHPAGGTRLKSWLTPWSSGEKVFASAPMKTPWRTLTIVSTPGELLLSRLMLNLNEPCAIEDTSWIVPSRYIGIWWGMHRKVYTWGQGDSHGATTENTKRYMDFAADNGFGGVLVEGWNYGWDGDWSANGNLFSFTRAYPDFDMEEITDYGRKKGVRLIGHHETGGATLNYEAQLDSAFALYERLGVNAVKTGYVNPRLDGKEYHSGQYGVRHYRKVIEAAARHHIMIDNHEPVMPTGLQRTYPNLMTQEGVRGCEYDAWSPDGGNPPEHTVTIPFTRCLAGPVDYTPGTFNYDNPVPPYTRPQATIAKQLAMTVVLYSPLQMASDMIENYEGRPEFEFLRECPTDWDATVVPEARIGEYLTVARRDKDKGNWYMGSMTNANPHNSRIPLDFLEPGLRYRATIYADGKGAHYRENPMAVEIQSQEVDHETTLNLNLAPGGGAAVVFTKI
ncbi:MAG: glycoside hydrolase family 97 protein [Muribaculaceae bacterium]|nr:glycoside hydrolase family 97 protein [Muribaculaceae bacterium]